MMVAYVLGPRESQDINKHSADPYVMGVQETILILADIFCDIY